MFIGNHILKQRLESVYFLWGRGKTTIANILRERYEAVKQEKIDAAYNAVAQNEGTIPEWVIRHHIPVIVWDDHTTPEETADAVAEVLGLTTSMAAT